MSSCILCKTTRGSAQQKEENLSYHEIPKRNEAVRRKWVEFCGRDYEDHLRNPPKKFTLCSRHFEPKCFRRHAFTTVVIPGSVPTLCPPVKENHKERGVLEPKHSLNTATICGPVALNTAQGYLVQQSFDWVAIVDPDLDKDNFRKADQDLESQGCSEDDNNLRLELEEDLIDSSGLFFSVNDEDNISTFENGAYSSDVRVILPYSEPPALQTDSLKACSERQKLLNKLKNELCRICAKKKETLSPICYEKDSQVELTLMKKVEMYLPVQIGTTDELPPNICLTCHELVESWHEKFVECSAADSVLRDIFGADKPVIIPDAEEEYGRSLKEDDLVAPEIKAVEARFEQDSDLVTPDIMEVEASIQEEDDVLISETEEKMWFQNEDDVVIPEIDVETSSQKEVDVVIPEIEDVKMRSQKEEDLHKNDSCDTVPESSGLEEQLKVVYNVAGDTPNFEMITVSPAEEVVKNFDLPPTSSLTNENYQSVNKASSSPLEKRLLSLKGKSSRSRPTLVRKRLLVPVRRCQSGEMVVKTSVLRRKVELALNIKSGRKLLSKGPKYFKISEDITKQFSDNSFIPTMMKNFSCMYCCAMFTFWHHYHDHMEKCKTEPTVCEMCGIVIPARALLKKHLRIHGRRKKRKNEPPQFCVCETCGKSMKTKVALKRHRLAFHSGEKRKGELIKCGKCNRKLKSRDSLERHVSAFHSERIIQREPTNYCETCCRLFVSPKTYKIHMELHEAGEVKTSINLKLTASEGPGSEVIFKCPVCGKTFPDKLEVIKHMNVKDVKRCSECRRKIANEKYIFAHRCKWWICQFCNKQFWSKQMCVKHEQVHTGERPHMCHICGKKLSSLHNLKCHQKIHELPTFECEHCPKVFKNEILFKIHLETHQEKRSKPVFKCEPCNKSFSNGVLFDIHMAKHDRDYYKCMFCEKLLMYPRSLQKHCRKFHGVSVSLKEMFDSL